MKIVTVIPGPKNDHGVHASQGTRVVLSDGSELQRVQEIELRASVGGFWTATITVAIEHAPTVDASLLYVEPASVTNTP